MINQNFLRNHSMLLRAFSAILGLIILIAISSIQNLDTTDTLIKFFNISLISFVCTGFSSFTIARFSKKYSYSKLILLILISTILIFSFIELVSFKQIFITHFLIVIGFLIREILSYEIRLKGDYGLAVIIREYIWRIILIIVILFYNMQKHEFPFEILFLISIFISFIIEYIIYVVYQYKNKINKIQEFNNISNKWSSIIILDIMGKVQSASVAAAPLIFTSHSDFFGQNLVALYILAERSWRPFGLFVSQGILDSQNSAIGIKNVHAYINKLLKGRIFYFFGAGIISIFSMIFLYYLYDLPIDNIALLISTVYVIYTFFFNIMNAHVFLNIELMMIIVRVLIAGTMVSILFISSVNFYVFVATILVTMILLDFYVLFGENKKETKP